MSEAPAIVGIAEALRAYIVEYPGIPDKIKKGDVRLDLLAPKGPSLCVQMNQGRLVKSYLDGTQIWEQPFTVIYRSPSTKSNEDKAGMIGFLNNLGSWMREKGPPELGGGARASAIGQLGLASITEQTDAEISYMASYGFEYELAGG